VVSLYFIFVALITVHVASYSSCQKHLS